MSRAALPTVFVGNDFVVAKPKLRAATPIATPEPLLVVAPAAPVQRAVEMDFTPPAEHTYAGPSAFERIMDLIHRYSLGVFAILFLVVGSTGIKVGSSYWAASIVKNTKPALVAKPAAHSIAGLNITVPNADLQAKITAIAAQPVTLAVGDQTATIPADTIKGWLQITASKDKAQNYIRVKPDAISASLLAIANGYVKAPVDQVTATHPDSSSAVIATGKNGTKLTNPDDLKTQAAAAAKTVMDAKGLSFKTSLETQAFATVTPAAFDKMIEVNVVTKQMYLFEKGNLTRTYPISAGASETPTPIGQYKIFSKLPVQDMKGYNPNGTKYFQPHVRWINYFLPGGYAVHGNYWRPTSFFGNVNSSHGCVSLPDDQAKEVYDWAPLGTTVITHA